MFHPECLLFVTVLFHVSWVRVRVIDIGSGPDPPPFLFLQQRLSPICPLQFMNMKLVSLILRPTLTFPVSPTMHAQQETQLHTQLVLS